MSPITSGGNVGGGGARSVRPGFRRNQIMKWSAKLAFGVMAATAIAAAPAFAQKSKDEMRVAVNDMFNALDPYVLPHDEAGVFNRTMFEPLIIYLEREKKFAGVIAKSFSQPSPGVFEFEIKDDLKFHSGNPLSADDVVYTMAFFADPAVK